MGYFKDLATRLGEAEVACAAAIRSEYLTILDMRVVGSAYITQCASPQSDLDVLCYVDSKSMSVTEMGFTGWKYGGSVGDGNDDHWGSWMKHIDGVGDVNMLVTTDEAYFNSWCTAAEVCRYLHMRGINIPRAERVAIHNIVMDDSDAEAEVQAHLPALFKA